MQKQLLFFLLVLASRSTCMKRDLLNESEFTPAANLFAALERVQELQGASPIETEGVPEQPENKKLKSSLIVKLKIPKRQSLAVQETVDLDPPIAPLPVVMPEAQDVEQNNFFHLDPDSEFNFDLEEIDLSLSPETQRKFDLLMSELRPTIAPSIDLLCAASPPVIGPTYYLVRYDPRLERHITFCASDRLLVVRNYLTYLLSDPSTPEFSTLHDKFQKQFPDQLVKQNGLEYALGCVHDGCNYCEKQPSADQVIMKIVTHCMLEHEQVSPWYQRINDRVAESFDQAIEALRRKRE